MRHLATFVVALACVAHHATASQVRAGGGATGQPAFRACSLLTRDLVAPFAENTRVLDLFSPEEETLGTSGSACEWGTVRLQLYSGGGKPPVSTKGLQPIAGVGQGGYFRNNREQYAELLAWTATHNFTLQVSVPTGKTAEALKPAVLKLANAIIAKLR
jgi:hypothetical protein